MKRSLPTGSLFTPDFADWLIVHCPICDFENTHVQRVYALEVDPDDDSSDPEGFSEHGELYGIPSGGIAEGWRRGAVVIEIDCENGHRFTLRFQQHKGVTFVIADELVS